LARQGQKQVRTRMRLLLVEDDPDLVALIKGDLVKAGFAIDVANNGVDAEHLGNTEPYDAVILDRARRRTRYRSLC